MLLSTIFFFIQQPNENGITILISGFLLTLTIYHFLLYFQHRDKAYLYYSLYTFLTFSYIFYKANHFFLADITEEYHAYFRFFTSPIQWVFNSVYLIFVKTFIDLKKEKPQWNTALNYIISFYFVLLALALIYEISTSDNAWMNRIYAFFFTPSMTLVAIITIYVVFTMKNVLKYYILIGSITYLVLGLTSYYSTRLTYGSTTLFYTAIVIENIFFALGLGAKQKKILLDKNLAQNEVIREHRINLELQEKIKSNLDDEVARKTKEIITLTQKNEEDERRKLELDFSRKTLDLRMKALQTQMNPHFLFNSLNSIKHYIIQNKNDDAVLFLGKIARLIRTILTTSERKEITLDEELKLLQLYLDIENMRLNQDIEYSKIIDPEINLKAYKIPPLVLQPFFENAIWHGLALKQGEKEIRIKISKDDTHLIICIRDNGIGRIRAAEIKDAKLAKKESLGIKLTKERLESFSFEKKNKVSIYFEDLEDETTHNSLGTSVFLKIPLY